MECEKCGTWNPDDKIRCWRCSAELPAPPEPRKSRKPSSQTWMWIVVALFIVLTTLMRCGFLNFGDGGDNAGFWQQPLSEPLGIGRSIESGDIGSGSVPSMGDPGSALHILTGYSTIATALWVGIG
jgi:hypothetical protein